MSFHPGKNFSSSEKKIIWFGLGGFLLERKGFSIAGRVAYSTNIFLKIKTDFLHDVILEMPSFSMRAGKYFYDKPLPKNLDPKTVLIYFPHPVNLKIHISTGIEKFSYEATVGWGFSNVVFSQIYIRSVLPKASQILPL